MNTLSEYRESVGQELARQYQLNQVSANSIDPFFAGLITEMDAFVARGGKRLRPYLLYLAYIGSNGQKEEDILPIAAALELLHNFLLIHDDIIDRDLVRYGGLNIQGVYRERFCLGMETRVAERHACDVALLAGDVTHLMSSQAVLSANFPAALLVQAMQIIHEVTFQVAGGELVDAILPLGLQDVPVEYDRIMSVYSNKTASYTFGLPLRLGTLLAGTGQATQQAIHNFSHPLGIGYQLADDLLGVYGNEEETGKTTEGDIREGRHTLMYHLAKEQLTGRDAELFTAVYGNEKASAAQTQSIRELFQRCGVRAQVEYLRDQAFDQASAALTFLYLTDEVSEQFSNLITQLRTRTS